MGFLCGLGVVGVETLGKGYRGRRNEFEVALAAQRQAVGNDIVGAHGASKHFAAQGEFAYGSRETCGLGLGQGIYLQRDRLRGPLDLHANAAATVEESIGQVERMVLLEHGAVERNGGYGNLAAALREEYVLKECARAVGCAVAVLNGGLYLIARQGDFLRHDALEVGLTGELRIGQGHSHTGMNAVGEQHGLLLIEPCAAGRHVDEKIALGDGTPHLLRLVWCGCCATLMACTALCAPAVRPRHGLHHNGARLEHAVA